MYVKPLAAGLPTIESTAAWICSRAQTSENMKYKLNVLSGVSNER